MNTRYELIIYWSKDDDCFVVEVPESSQREAVRDGQAKRGVRRGLGSSSQLPGCMADGQTSAEAGKNAEALIAEWIAVTQRKSARPGFPTARELGGPIPEPRGRLAYALTCRSPSAKTRR